MNTGQLFQTVPSKDYFSLSKGGNLDYSEVVKTLQFKKEDVSKATGAPLSSIRYEEEKIPKEVKDRITEWATLLNLVAQQFQGDIKKTCLWFTMPNPLLGNISPRDMIRFGRYKKLLKFILTAMSGDIP